MPQLNYALVALLIASVSVAVPPVAKRYLGACSFLTPTQCLSFYIYGLFYGIIAFTIIYLRIFDLLPLTGSVNPWIRVVIVGFGIKKFIHILLFKLRALTKSSENDSPPTDVRTIIQVIDTWFLDAIDHDMTNALHRFLDPRVKKYSDSEYVKKQIMQNLSLTMTPDQQDLFVSEIEQRLNDPKGGILAAMQYYLIYMGKKNLKRIFPL